MRYFKRSSLIFFFFISILTIILSYICLLQTYYYQYFIQKSINNYTRFERVETLRGVITDENNHPIAFTKPIIKLLWHKYPSILSDEDSNLLNFIEEMYQRKIDFNCFPVVENNLIIDPAISFDKLSLLLENFPHSKRISLQHELKRHYPHKNLFCHIIGYTNKNKDAVFGLERIYNNQLIGKSGLMQNIVNAKGNIIDYNFLEIPEEGHCMKTTLNINLQKGIASVFPADESGCAIVIDPMSGAIKALYSAPTFDPEIFQNGVDSEMWDLMQKNKSLMNRVFQAQYSPGSIYKLLIALILLEEGLIKEHTQWFCNGYFQYKDRKYRCNKKSGHGLVEISDGICYSCNIPFFAPAVFLSIDTVAKHAGLFELGKATGLFEKELHGVIPSKAWKKKKFGIPWFGGETLSVVLGQGATAIPPIQIANIIMGIMHGYIIKPYILADSKNEKIILPYKKENLQIIRNNMKMGAKKGSSRALASMMNWEIYAKTGTSQLCSLEFLKKNAEKKNYHNGLFACWAKYKNEKPMIIIFVIENNGTARFTVEVVKKFLLYCEKEIYQKT